MIVLKDKDFLEVKQASLVADYDRDILVNLYEPIIGFAGLATYFTLLAEANNQRTLSVITHDVLFEKMKITVGQFVDARKLLEGIGLLKTYLSSTTGAKIYHYEVFAPRSPKDFFDNTLLYGMLIKAIGSVEAGKMKSLYKFETADNKGDEISSSFVDAYKPDFEDPAFGTALNNNSKMVGRRGAHIDYEFSFEKFFEFINAQSQISSQAFTKKDMKEIERITTLYGLDEQTAANAVVAIYNPAAGKGKHVDFEQLAKNLQEETRFSISSLRRKNSKIQVESNSDLAKKINFMESTSPAKFLSALQNGTKPATPDLKLINDISSGFGLSNGVINALIDYTLQTNNNILSKNYVEKVAASLAREGVSNAIDAMNYLNKVKKGNRKETKKDEFSEPSNIKEEIEFESQSVEVVETSNLDWNSLIDEIDEGGSDGKA